MAEIRTGISTTYNIHPDRREIEVRDTILLKEPDAAPFTLILRQSNREKTESTEFAWFESSVINKADKINNAGGYTETDTELKVDNVNYFMPNQVIKVPRTSEEMLVVGVDEANSKIIVRRGYGESPASPLNDDEDLLIIGTAFKEGSKAPQPRSTKVIKVTNYTQIFKTVFGVSDTIMKTKQKGGKEFSFRQREAAINHYVDIEHAFLFGEKKEDIADERRKTGGVVSFIKTNVFNIPILTEDEFNKVLRRVYRYNRLAKGKSVLTMFTSSMILEGINRWARPRIELRPTDDSYGISIGTYIHPYGTPLRIVLHPLFEDLYQGWAIIVNMRLLRYRYIPGRDTVLKTNIQENDEDARKDMYLTEAGLELQQEQRHAVIKGVESIS